MIHDNQFEELGGITKQTCENSKLGKFILFSDSAVKADAVFPALKKKKKYFRFILSLR